MGDHTGRGLPRTGTEKQSWSTIRLLYRNIWDGNTIDTELYLLENKIKGNLCIVNFSSYGLSHVSRPFRTAKGHSRTNRTYGKAVFNRCSYSDVTLCFRLVRRCCVKVC